MLHHPKTLSALTTTAQADLADLLALPPHFLNQTTGQPSSAWLATQAHHIATTLPTALRAPHTLLARVVLLLASTKTHQRAVLCAAHSGLNSRVVRAVFSLLTAEIGRQARPLRQFVRHPDRYLLHNHHHHHHNTSGEEETRRRRRRQRQGRRCLGRMTTTTTTVASVGALVNRLAGVEALWLAPGAFARAHSGLRTRHVYVEGGCEACVLAVVGGDAGVLRDLWALVLGRTHRRKGKAPVLGGLVAAWMRNLEDDEMARGEESEKLGRVVKSVRRAVWKRRHDKGRVRSDISRKSESAAGKERDSGYGSDDDLVAWRGLEDRQAKKGQQVSFSPSTCGRGREGRDDDDDGGDEDGDFFARTAVEYDVFLRRKQPVPHEPGALDASNTTQAMSQQCITEAEYEYDVVLRKRQPVSHQYQQPGALEARRSGNLNISHFLIAKRDEEEYDGDDDDDDDDDRVDDEYDLGKRQLGARCKTHTGIDDVELHAAYCVAARDSLVVGLDGQGDLRSSLSGMMMTAKPLDTDLVDNLAQREERYDPAQWTDVSVATRELRSEFVDLVRGCGSSSVYSNAGTAVPHPSPALSTFVEGVGNLRQSLTPSEELDWMAWPNPFATAESTSTSSGSSSSGYASCYSSAWLQRAATGAVEDGTRAPVLLPPDEFQKALDELEELSLVDGAADYDSDTAGIPKRMLLPGESVSVVGRVEMRWRSSSEETITV